MGMDKNCDNCKHSGRPSYEWPCTACTSAYGSAPSKWEIGVPIPEDMVEVVRCNDCKWWKDCHCTNINGAMGVVENPDWFCAAGERKDND